MNDAPRQPLAMPHYVFVFLISLGLWLLLAGSLRIDELILGSVIALTVSVLFTHRFSIFSGFRISLYAPFYIMVYLFNFSIALIRANLDLARRVLSPSLPINPALVRIQTQLQSPLARLLLANTITLTPGTLTVDVVDDELLVHWVYCPPGTDIEQATQQIAATFERDLGRFLK
jgi:multicomponent Na+:H+ antiporter subunit E